MPMTREEIDLIARISGESEDPDVDSTMLGIVLERLREDVPGTVVAVEPTDDPLWGWLGRNQADLDHISGEGWGVFAHGDWVAAEHLSPRDAVVAAMRADAERAF